MKGLITILCLFISNFSFSQKRLDGTYCSRTDFVGYCLNFKNDSLFEYSSWTCMGGKKGNGIYRLDGKQLTLNFVTKDCFKSSYSFIEGACSENDSTTLTFLFMDYENNYTIPFVEVSVQDSVSISTIKSADVEGNCRLKVKKSTEELQITLKYAGYEKFSFKINADNCKDIKVNLLFILDKECGKERKWEFTIEKDFPKKYFLYDLHNKIKLTKLLK